MFKRSFIILGIMALLLAACSAPKMAPSLGARSTGDNAASGGQAPAQQAPAQPPSPALVSNQSPYSSILPEVKRIVIKDANLTLAVDDPAKSMENITKMAEEMNGFVVSAKLFQNTLDSGAEVPEATITIRVPAERLDEALTRIKAETTRPVINETVESQDVTKEYTDLQSRLTNLQVAEAKLKEIMGSATKTEDVLNVYNQLTQVQEQIEVIKGQIQYYDQSAALSSISTDLKANEAVQPLTVGGWQPAGIAKGAVQALINTLKTFATVGIYLGLYLLPVLIILGVVVFAIVLVVRAIRKRLKGGPQIVPPPAS